jgi:hypothetical protein
MYKTLGGIGAAFMLVAIAAPATAAAQRQEPGIAKQAVGEELSSQRRRYRRAYVRRYRGPYAGYPYASYGFGNWGYPYAYSSYRSYPSTYSGYSGYPYAYSSYSSYPSTYSGYSSYSYPYPSYTYRYSRPRYRTSSYSYSSPLRVHRLWHLAISSCLRATPGAAMIA